jgi:hypothetical protein
MGDPAIALMGTLTIYYTFKEEGSSGLDGRHSNGSLPGGAGLGVLNLAENSRRMGEYPTSSGSSRKAAGPDFSFDAASLIPYGLA